MTRLADKLEQPFRRLARSVRPPLSSEEQRQRVLRYEEQRQRVLAMLPRDSVGCEVGTWEGHFSAAIIDIARPRELHLVDPWMFDEDPRYAEAWYGGAFARSQADMDRVYEGVLSRFRPLIDAGVVVVHRAASADAVSDFDDNSLDWVYIDGNHLYEYVRGDLEGFATKVRRGGIIAGDDYGEGGWWGDGVTRAVDEFVAGRRDFKSDRLGAQFVLKRL